MGANEKHTATYHGGEYTPSETALITAWSDHRRNFLEYTGEPFEGVVERTAQAQRTIAKIRAEAKAEAWDACSEAWEQAHSLDNIEPWGYLPDNPYKENQS